MCKAIPWKGCAMPPSDAPGNHSYSVKVLSNTGLQWSIDVLRHEAFYIKKPEQCKGHYSWKKWGSISACWSACMIPQIATKDFGLDEQTLRISAIDLDCLAMRDVLFDSRGPPKKAYNMDSAAFRRESMGPNSDPESRTLILSTIGLMTWGNHVLSQY